MWWSCCNPLHSSLWLHLLCPMYRLQNTAKPEAQMSQKPGRKQKRLAFFRDVIRLNSWKSEAQGAFSFQGNVEKRTRTRFSEAAKCYNFETLYLIQRATIEIAFPAKAWTSDQTLRAGTRVPQVDRPCTETERAANLRSSLIQTLTPLFMNYL